MLPYLVPNSLQDRLHGFGHSSQLPFLETLGSSWHSAYVKLVIRCIMASK